MVRPVAHDADEEGDRDDCEDRLEDAEEADRHFLQRSPLEVWNQEAGQLLWVNQQRRKDRWQQREEQQA
jgi:hypothetical protein